MLLSGLSTSMHQEGTSVLKMPDPIKNMSIKVVINRFAVFGRVFFMKVYVLIKVILYIYDNTTTSMFQIKAEFVPSGTENFFDCFQQDIKSVSVPKILTQVI